MKQPIMNSAMSEPATAEPSVTAAQLSSVEIQNMMANVRKQIEEKKRLQQQRAMPVAPMAVPVAPPAAPSLPVDGKSRIAQLEAQIKASLASRPNLASLAAQR